LFILSWSCRHAHPLPSHGDARYMQSHPKLVVLLLLLLLLLFTMVDQHAG
jgi:hypothetical protein